MGAAEVRVVSPEDFIVNELIRSERGVQDEKEVKSILSRLRGSIDRSYLDRRVNKTGSSRFSKR